MIGPSSRRPSRVVSGGADQGVDEGTDLSVQRRKRTGELSITHELNSYAEYSASSQVLTRMIHGVLRAMKTRQMSRSIERKTAVDAEKRMRG